jgi:hypothetical protein
MKLGEVVVDLTKQALPVRRPDVAQHFSLAPGDDEHGFYALIDLTNNASLDNHLELLVTLASGETTATLWPVSYADALTASNVEPSLAALEGLLRHLPRHEAKRLVEFTTPALGRLKGADSLLALPAPMRLGIDLCCILENQILFASGWVLDPANELARIELRVGGLAFDVLRNRALIPRPDLNPDTSLYKTGDAPLLPGFVFAQRLPLRDSEVQEARFTVTVEAETFRLTRPLCHDRHEARREFLSLLSKMDADSVLVSIGRVADVLEDSSEVGSLPALLDLIRNSAIERLPPSIQHTNPRYALHVDQAIPVADEGIFLTGWLNAEPRVSAQVVCQCGASTFNLSDNWIRHARPDVTSHLANLEVQAADHRHGFSCYVPIANGSVHYYLTLVSESCETRRMRVVVSKKVESALQTVRALLSFFSWEHPELRLLMDRQVGPAVRAAWTARQRRLLTPVVRSYGPKPADPRMTIVVPLYGRYDFAEYQMAIFANDPEFQDLELIYIVDDPTIFEEFLSRCPGLYGIYQVPFVLGFSGANLGFAGANNFGAELGRGQYLLFMNSDVLPKRPGCVGDLLRTYQSLPQPGLLGAKLLYEDGSVQHAGMSFRRHAGWGDLWINDHPLKGQTPLGLSGVREVEAVTAACAMIEAALYRDLGGFSEDYIIGDFEDSDLCLRASTAGRRSYIDLDVEFYHLERQSQKLVGDPTWRINLTIYNCWLYNARWGELIERTREQRPAVGNPIWRV